MIPAACIKQIFGERFAMRPTTFTMPWGTVYVCVELVLMYSDTSWRIGGTHWVAIDETFDEAYTKACGYVREGMEG